MQNIRTYETFQEIFKESPELEKVFLNFCEYTTSDVKSSRFDIYTFDTHKVGYEEYLEYASSAKIIEKSQDVIAHYIDILIRYGLICYEMENPFTSDNSDESKDEDRFNYYKNAGHPTKDSNLKLTGYFRLDGSCTGYYYYGKLLKIRAKREEEESFEKEIKEALISSVHEVIDPDIEKIKDLVNRTDKKLQEIEKQMDQSAVKNIEVLSIFVAIIALLFSNISALQNYDAVGLYGIFIVNASTIIGILSLLLFTEVLIIKKKLSTPAKIMVGCVYIMCILDIMLLSKF